MLQSSTLDMSLGDFLTCKIETITVKYVEESLYHLISLNKEKKNNDKYE